jgi:tetratricopeptide (TPR) repeat protein
MKTKLHNYQLLLCLLLLVLVQYGNTLQHGYAFDDYMFIVGNEHLERGWSGIPYFFKHIYVADESTNNIYRPTVFAAYIIERELFGKSPMVLHFFNVFYFALLCGVLYKVLRLLMSRLRGGEQLAILTTVLFVVHPSHTEVVANIKSRDEIYSLLGCLCCAFYILKYFENNKKYNLIFVLISFLFAIFSKFNAITFLAIAPLLAWHMKPPNLPLSKLILPTAGIVAMLLLSVVLYRGNAKLLKSAQLSNDNDKAPYKEVLANSLYAPQLSSTERVATALGLLPRYLGQLTVAQNMPYYSGYPYVKPLHLSNWQALLGLFFYTFLFFGGFYWFIRKPRPIFLAQTAPNDKAPPSSPTLSFEQIAPFCGLAFLWFVISLSVYANLVKLAPDTFALRYLFAPSVGYCWALLLLLAYLFKVKFPDTGNWARQNWSFLAIFALICLFYGVKTYQRNKVWENSYTLFAADMEQLDQCARAHTYMAAELTRQSAMPNKQPKLNLAPNSIYDHYERATQLFPSYAEAYNFWAKALATHGKVNDALNVCEKAQQHCPNDKSTIFCTGETLYLAEKYADAIPHLEKALLNAKDLKKSYDLLAWAYYKTQQHDQAHQLLDSALLRFPQTAYFAREKGKMYFLDKQMPQALPLLRQAYQLDSIDRQTLHMLANAYAEIGDTTNAKHYALKFNALPKP